MKKLVLCLALSALAGCAATGSLPQGESAQKAQPAITYTSLASVEYTPLSIYDEAVKHTLGISDKTGQLVTSDTVSSVVGWKIPAYGAYRFKLSSQIQRAKFGTAASAFMPQVHLLDKDFQVVETLSAKQLVYQPPGLLEQEHFYHSFVVDNQDPMLPLVEYMVMIMTNDGRRHKIQVVDLEKEYAKARGYLPPATKDVIATASESGSVTLEAMMLTSAYAVGSAPKPAYAPPVQTGKMSAVTHTDTVLLSKAYLEAVQQLLTAGDIQGALILRENANRLYSGLQRLFSSQYSRAGRVMTDEPVSENESIDQRLVQAYRKQLVTHLQQDDVQSALGVIDQSRTLIGHINALF